MLVESPVFAERPATVWGPPLAHHRTIPAPRTRPASPESLTEPAAVGMPSAEWTTRFAQALVEVRAGIRPVTYLARFVSPAVFEGLRKMAVDESLRGNRVLSVHSQSPHASAIEACATLRGPHRVRAMAFRLQRHRDRWRCVHLEIR